MPNWKKVIVSGSNAVLNQITASGIINDSTVEGTQLTGSFTGSFAGSHTGSFVGDFSGNGSNLSCVGQYQTGAGADSIRPRRTDNSAVGNCSNVSGGNKNCANGNFVFIGGGTFNTSSAPYSAIGGGCGNKFNNTSCLSSIVGGHCNIINKSCYSFIGGGQQNCVKEGLNSSLYVSIVGGYNHLLRDNSYPDEAPNYAFIGGGDSNEVNSSCGGTIVGGADHEICYRSHCSAILGGKTNKILCTSQVSVIGGGHTNTISGSCFASILGGCQNCVQSFNFINSSNSIIGGGCNNTISGNSKHGILGGSNNSFHGTNCDPRFIIGDGISGTYTATGCYTYVNNLCAWGTNGINGIVKAKTLCSTKLEAIVIKAGTGTSVLSDDITSTGTLQLTGSNQLSHITASGNISASGILIPSIYTNGSVSTGTNVVTVDSTGQFYMTGSYSDAGGGSGVVFEKVNSPSGTADICSFKPAFGTNTLSTQNCTTGGRGCNSILYGDGNIVNQARNTVGGFENKISSSVADDLSTNKNFSQFNTVFGGRCNTIGVGTGETSCKSVNNTIIGGCNSIISDTNCFTTIIGGHSNTLGKVNSNSTLVGGILNKISGSTSFSSKNILVGTCNASISSSNHNDIGSINLVVSGSDGAFNTILTRNNVTIATCRTHLGPFDDTITEIGSLLQCSVVIGVDNSHIKGGAHQTMIGSKCSEIFANCSNGNCGFDSIISSNSSKIHHSVHSTILAGAENVISGSIVASGHKVFNSIIGGCRNCIATSSFASIINSRDTNLCNTVTGPVTAIGLSNVTLEGSSFNNHTVVQNLCVYGTNGSNGRISGVELVSSKLGKFGSATSIIGDDITSTGTLQLTGSAGHITASGNISASGNLEITNITSTGTLLLTGSTGHITASGNISASGTITGQNVEVGSLTSGQVVFADTNGKLSSDAGMTYNPTTDQLTVTSLDVIHLTSSFITSSVIKTSGSNIFGDDTTDVQTLIGTTKMTGSAQVTGSLNVDGIFTLPDIANVSASIAAASITTTPTLQQVTDQGATTTNDITITGSLIVSGSAEFRGIEDTSTNVVIGKNTIGSSANTVVIGNNATTISGGQNNTIVGADASVIQNTSYGVVIGQNAYVNGTNGVALGRSTTAGGNGIAIGRDAEAPSNSIAIGKSITANASQLEIGFENPTISASLSTGHVILSGSEGGLELIGSGSTLFEVIGSEGTLFSVDDDLDGTIFTANDRSGFPVLEASASGEVYIGKSPQSLYTTAVISSTTANTSQSLAALSTSSYDGAFFDYTAHSGSDARAGSIMSVWNGANLNFTETTTTDIGSTTDLILKVEISESKAQLLAHATNAGYKIKTIIRSI